MKLLKLLDDLADAATWAAYTLWQLKLGSPILIFCEQKRIATNITPTQKSRMDFVKWLNYVITTPAKGYKTLDACTECQKTPHGGPRDLRRFIFFFGPVLPHQSMLHFDLTVWFTLCPNRRTYWKEMFEILTTNFKIDWTYSVHKAE